MKNDAGSKKSSQDGRLKVEALQLTGPARLLSAASGEGGLFMVLSGSGMLFWNQGPEGGVGAGPGSVLLLGRRDCDFEPAGGWPAELLGCRFPLEMMTEVQKARLVDGSKGPLVLLGDPVWSNRVHTLLELAAGAWQEPDCPGRLYLSLLMHYVGKEAAAEGGSASQPRNETIEKICAYLTANYNQKLTLSSVAAQFYLSPYYLSRLFRRVTGQSIVDFINVRRIEAARRLLESTDLGINDVAEETGFSTTAHFRASTTWPRRRAFPPRPTSDGSSGNRWGSALCSTARPAAAAKSKPRKNPCAGTRHRGSFSVGRRGAAQQGNISP